MDDDEFADAAADLQEAMRELRRDLEREAPRGPLGLPRPPTPGELLKFADEAAIPTMIAILEANVRALEAIQHAIRLADRGRELHDRGEDTGERVATVGGRTLERFDDAVAQLQRAVEETPLPENEAARGILEEARELRSELDRRASGAAETADSGSDSAVDDRGLREEDDSASGDGDDGTSVDVDAELDSLRRTYGADPPDDDPGSDDSGGSGSDDAPDSDAAESDD